MCYREPPDPGAGEDIRRPVEPAMAHDLAPRLDATGGAARRTPRDERIDGGMQAPSGAEERTSSGGIVEWSASRCASAETLTPSGCTPCVTIGSWFGSPTSTIDAAQVPAAMTFASEYCPASSTNRTSSVRSISARAICQDVPATTFAPAWSWRRSPRARRQRHPRVMDPWVQLAGALDDAKRRGLRVRLGGTEDLLDEVADRPMRLRRDPDALPCPNERRDHPGRRVGLSGPGRSLNRQDTMIQCEPEAAASAVMSEFPSSMGVADREGGATAAGVERAGRRSPRRKACRRSHPR